MAELKKCPFCGGEAKHEIFDDGFFTWGRVECKQCGAMITTPPVNTIETWNNRATEAEIRAKAYERFAEKLKESLLKNYRHFITTDTDGFDWLTTDAVGTHIDKVVDQLKEG